jgi:hypothetical protein
VVTAPPYASRGIISGAAQGRRQWLRRNAGRSSQCRPGWSVPKKRGAVCYPQHIHSLPTGLILGMRERPHGLAAQQFTGAKNPPASTGERAPTIVVD